METHSEAAAMKSNSTVASIKLGYRLYASNFKKIFKSSWFFALLFGVVLSILGPILSIKMPALLTQATVNPTTAPALAGHYWGLTALSFVLIIVGGLIEVAFYSYGFHLLRSHNATGAINRPPHWLSFDKSMAWRTLKGIAASLLVVLIVEVLMAALYYIGIKTALIKPDAYVGFAVWTLIALVFTLLTTVPLCFITMKYILDDTTCFWSLFAKAYAVGLRHFGYIFIVCLFAAVVIAVVSIVLQLPATIVATANYQANLGVFYGDPLGMPSYIVPLTSAVFLVSGFMQAYIRLSAIFPLYYMYGSIETQEKEKKQFALDTNTETDR